MELLIEDLGQHGLWLIGPGSKYYDQWLEEILQRGKDRGSVSAPLAGIDKAERPASAILVNGSGKDIAAWTMIWRFQRKSGPGSVSTASHGIGVCPSLLLPFGLTEADLLLIGYRMTILAGSKRYVGGGRVLGDNRDVRPPEARGAMGEGFPLERAQRHSMDWNEMRSATLTLDGVFFTDGEFVGHDEAGSYSRVITEAAVHAETARMVREGLERGETAGEILERVCQTGGDGVPEHPVAGGAVGTLSVQIQRSHYTRRDEARMVEMYRRHEGDVQTLRRLAAWDGAVLPEFRRRA